MQRPERPEVARGAGSQRVLVADDVESSREYLVAALSRLGVEVLVARDGIEAFELARTQHPDAVVLDVQMPGQSGLEVCRRLRAEPASALTPIVLVTALSSLAHRVEALDAGADDFLTKPVDALELTARVRSMLRLNSLYRELEQMSNVLSALARIAEARDYGTSAHAARVARSAERLGGEVGLSSADMARLRRAALVHDIGKVGVPDAILLKPGPLTTEEQAVMRSHTTIGVEILSPLRVGADLVDVVHHHHERVDGRGYPESLSGKEMSMASRIVAIADAYDAMSNDRPYRNRYSHVDVLRLLAAGAGSQWDAELVRLFIELQSPASAARGHPGHNS